MLNIQILFLFPILHVVYSAYTVHVIDKKTSYNSTEVPELYAVQNIYHSVDKIIRLQDGRIVKCQIPIEQMSSPITKPLVVRNLTEDEVNIMLFPLEDQCVQHRTSEFLYEYCFKKYARQYDDYITVINSQKRIKEEFSIGYSNQYNKHYNETRGIRQPQQGSYSLDSFIHKIVQLEPVIIIQGCVAKLRNYNKELLRNKGYSIFIRSEHQTYNFSVMYIIHQQLMLLDSCTNDLIISEDFELNNSSRLQEQLNTNNVYAYKNIIFSLQFRAQSMFHQQQTLLVKFTTSVTLVTVDKVVDFCLIQVDGLKFSKNKRNRNVYLVEQLIIMDGNHVYEMSLKPIWIVDNVALLSPLEVISANDSIVLFDKDLITYSESYQITSLTDSIATLSQQFTIGLRHYGHTLIKRGGQYNYKLNQSTTISYQTQEDQECLDNMTQWILDKPYLQFYFPLHIKQFIGFAFQLIKLKQSNDPSLHILIESRIYAPIEISFLKHPEERIYIKTHKLKGEYTQMDPRFMNQTIFQEQYWVVIDTMEDILYLGKSIEINLSTKMNTFKLNRTDQVGGHMRIQIQPKSRGVKLIDLVELPLTNYKVLRDELNSDRAYHALNYTGHVDAIYHEHYTNGSWCKPMNTTRQSEVILQCQQGTLMSFISITEPSVCRYQIHIGTHLLCENNNNMIDVISNQHIMCVLQ